MNKIGSSETIRKTTFNFYNYKQNTVSHKNHIENSFLEWFIGFAEGDGSFIVSNQRLFFIINHKEPQILHKIRTNLGFGKVSYYLSYSRYIVADQSNVDRLIFLFNGNLLLEKTNAFFSLWLDARNLYSKDPICFLSQNKYQTLSGNGWLSGFIDSKGCFNTQQGIEEIEKIEGTHITDKIPNKDTLYFNVKVYIPLIPCFVLDPLKEYKVLEKLKLFLEKGDLSISYPSYPSYTSSPIEKKKETDSIYIFSCIHTRGHDKLLEYLYKYPLRTLKKVSFLRWVSVLYYIKNRKNLPWQGKVLNRIENLIKNNNSLYPL